MSRSVLYISNVFGPCRYWTSEQRRAAGFRHYLPEFGWDCRLLVKRCNCSREGEPADDTVRVPYRLPAAAGAMGGFFGGAGGQWPDAGTAIQLECAPGTRCAAWIALARASGFRFANREEEAEVCHLVFPFPGLNDDSRGRPSALRRTLLPAVKALGFAVGRVHEQDRIDWVPRGIAAGETLARQLGIDAIVGSYPGTQNLRIAAMVSRRTGIPWIADFRDCVSRGWCSSKADEGRVRRLLRTAAAAVYVTPQEAARDAGLRSTDMATETVENGFMSDAPRVSVPSRAGNAGILTVRFLGAIYPQRNLDMFLDGLQRLLESDAELRSRIVFEYYGFMFDEVRAEITCRGLETCCRGFEPVGSAQALRLTAEADVLVLPTDVSGMSGVPGAKFYEYLGVRRPILAAGGRDAYVADVLARTGAGRGCWSVEEVSATLEEWFRGWCEKGLVDLPFAEAETARYSRRDGARRLARLLEGIVPGDR